MASNIDTTLGAQQLRAEFDNSEQLILPGQFVRVRLVTGERDGCSWCRKPPWRKANRARG